MRFDKTEDDFTIASEIFSPELSDAYKERYHHLIDLLRELAINGTQIIITTADRQMAKYLRRKFSFFQNEYTHFELNRKGSEMTSIKINHYSYDKKAVMG